MDGQTGDDVDTLVDVDVGQLECDLLPLGIASRYRQHRWQARLLPADVAVEIASINYTNGRALIVPKGRKGRFNVSGQLTVECKLIGPDNETVLDFNRTIKVDPSKYYCQYYCCLVAFRYLT